MASGGTWLDRYIAYAQDLTDAPAIFHKFVGLTIVGAAMGSHWKQPNHEGGWTYPYLWCLLLAKSSLLHKSAASKIGLRIAREVGIPHIPAYGSTEAMTDLLMKQKWGLMYADEYDQFARGLNREYAAGRGFFASLYDGMIAPQVFRHGTSPGAMDIACGFLACTTVAWLTDQLKESDITGGLLPRFIVVPAYTKERTMELPPSQIDHDARKSLVAELKPLMTMDRICHRTPGADMLYASWYRREMQIPMDGTRGESWPMRLTATCHKLSMIFLALRNPLLPQITEIDMQNACETMSWAIAAVKHLLTSEIALTKIEHDLQTVKHILQQHGSTEGWVPYSTVLRYSHLEARRLQEVMTTAQQSELIELGKARRGHAPLRLVIREPGVDDR